MNDYDIDSAPITYALQWVMSRTYRWDTVIIQVLHLMK